MTNRIITMAAAAAALALVPAQSAFAGISTSPGAFDQEMEHGIAPMTAQSGYGVPPAASGVEAPQSEAPEAGDAVEVPTPDTGVELDVASEDPHRPEEDAPTVGEAQSTSGAATGDGPADEQECDTRAALIEALNTAGDMLYGVGEAQAGEAAYDTSNEIRDEGVDRGCAFSHPGGSEIDE